MEEIEKKKIVFPKDKNGKEYWISIVIKNRDTLVGFLEAFKNFCKFYEIPTATDVNVIISSDRFNDVLPDDSRMRNYSREDLKEKILDMIDKEQERSEKEENDGHLLQDNILNLDCNGCGMFYSFKTSRELPEADFDCQCCGRKLIYYINVDADSVMYDGNESFIDSVMEEINEDMDLE